MADPPNPSTAPLPPPSAVCGAPTRKGTPCRRKPTGPQGRCHLHTSDASRTSDASQGKKKPLKKPKSQPSSQPSPSRPPPSRPRSPKGRAAAADPPLAARPPLSAAPHPLPPPAEGVAAPAPDDPDFVQTLSRQEQEALQGLSPLDLAIALQTLRLLRTAQAEGRHRQEKDSDPAGDDEKSAGGPMVSLGKACLDFDQVLNRNLITLTRMLEAKARIDRARADSGSEGSSGAGRDGLQITIRDFGLEIGDSDSDSDDSDPAEGIDGDTPASGDFRS